MYPEEKNFEMENLLRGVELSSEKIKDKIENFLQKEKMSSAIDPMVLAAEFAMRRLKS